MRSPHSDQVCARRSWISDRDLPRRGLVRRPRDVSNAQPSLSLRFDLPRYGEQVRKSSRSESLNNRSAIASAWSRCSATRSTLAAVLTAGQTRRSCARVLRRDTRSQNLRQNRDSEWRSCRSGSRGAIPAHPSSATKIVAKSSSTSGRRIGPGCHLPRATWSQSLDAG